MAARSFAGTTQKCTACNKTVYLVDKLTADTRPTTKPASDAITAGAPSSLAAIVRLRESSTADLTMINSSSELAALTRALKNAKTVSSLFGGTRDKCVGCNKTVYPIEKVTVNGTPYHKSCFKCTHGGCTISPSNYIAHEGSLYCKHHHVQLFKEKGNYGQLEGVI